MQKIKIVTDSTIDMRKDLIEEYDITVVPLSITIDDKQFTDGVDITPDVFIKMMNQSIELPKSSQPPAGEFLRVYEELSEDGSSIISIHMTKGLSGTVQSAQSAAQMAEADVTVLDSMFISKALGFQVLEAAKMAKEGSSKEQILHRIAEIRDQTRLYLSVDTLENLVKGGRIGRGKALIGSLLNIKPIAKLQDGLYTPVGKVRSQSQAVKYLAKQFAEDVKGKTVKAVGIAHADAHDFAQRLKQAVLEISPNCMVDISFTTPVVSTHTGPGAVGFMFFAE
ncbi:MULTISPECIES: DegV family protein [Bacillaceae]|uniref:DegV family protein n=1 Tax=Bacillaceae TaxID=186817 RepID=UPI000BFB25F7|nr:MULTISPECIES: DegV family protein [Bacillaceae]PGT83071.1 fatty acid-binding protein DegV [Bacillus sp. AFS040349]UGB29150.1 DegV family protein [Metabacillus sp. B2-18]